MAQQFKELVQQRDIPLFGAVNGLLCQVIAQHIARIDGIHAFDAHGIRLAIRQHPHRPVT